MAHKLADLVKQTSDQNAATESAATERVSMFTWLLCGVSAAVFLIVYVVASSRRRTTTSPSIGALPTYSWGARRNISTRSPCAVATRVT